MMRRPACLLLSLLLLFSLSACGGDTAQPGASPSADSSGEPAAMEFSLPRTAATLHPILGTDRTNLTLAPLLWEGLFALDNTFTPQNVLCESFTASADKLVWTFTLRAGITFSDGSALTATDAAQSLQLAMQAGTRYAQRLSGVRSVSASDARTLTVTLAAPNGNLPALLDIPIVKGTGDPPLGTGPYVLKSQGDSASLERRADWWQNAALPYASISLKTVDGADNLIYAFDTRDVSLVATDLTGTNALGYSTGYEAWDCPTTTMLFVGFNAAKGACSDAMVRQALSRSFDRTTVATALFARHAVPAVLPVSPASSLYDTALAAELDYSTEAAAGILTQAGYAQTNGILRKDGKKLSLTFLVNSESSFKVSAADYLAGELGKLGVDVDLKKLSWADYEQELRAGNFDLYLGETMLTADFNLSALITWGGALNFGSYGSPDTTAFLSAFLAAGADTRTQAASALYRKLGADAPFAVLGFKNASVLTQWGTVSGLSPTQNDPFHDLSAWNQAGGT